jgi:hypothetical protein
VAGSGCIKASGPVTSKSGVRRRITSYLLSVELGHERRRDEEKREHLLTGGN